jgi:hypothetical protein
VEPSKKVNVIVMDCGSVTALDVMLPELVSSFSDSPSAKIIETVTPDGGDGDCGGELESPPPPPPEQLMLSIPKIARIYRFRYLMVESKKDVDFMMHSFCVSIVIKN